jgi:hypothetical protein
VTRSVDEVEQVELARRLIAVKERDRLRLDRDAAAALDLQRVEQLRA